MIDQLADFHFIRPGWLLLAPLAVGLWWRWRQHTDPLRGWREQIDPELLDAMLVDRSSAKSDHAWWVLVPLLLAVIAIAGPTWRLEPSPFAANTAPLMILLKADSSMDAPDPPPSRIERAHLKIADLAEARKGQPLGLIAYAGSAHLVLPPTRDTAVIASMAAEISPDIMPVPGDRLDLALGEAARILEDGGQGGSVVVLADAVASDTTTLRAAHQAHPVPVQFLSINSPSASPADSLEAAANALGAKIEPLDVDGRDVAAIVRRARSTPTSKGGHDGEHWQEAGYWLVPALALIMLFTFRRETHPEDPAP